jgi:hypothetical protein
MLFLCYINLNVILVQSAQAVDVFTFASFDLLLLLCFPIGNQPALLLYLFIEYRGCVFFSMAGRVTRSDEFGECLIWERVFRKTTFFLGESYASTLTKTNIYILHFCKICRILHFRRFFFQTHLVTLMAASLASVSTTH